MARLDQAAYVKDEKSEQIARTVPGMAHFALTGPLGKVCDDCKHHVVSNKRSRGGTLFVCQKFAELMRVTEGPPVPKHTPSCRHFVDRAYKSKRR